MRFGQVDHPEEVDFSLPPTHPGTMDTLKGHQAKKFENIRIGCAKWNKQDLKNFYPRGTKDELAYYSTQFNSIELNASFYRMFPEKQFETWNSQAEGDFQFFPKVPRIISHIKRLNDCEILVDDFIRNISPLRDKLGMVFLQMPDNFQHKYIERLKQFFENWPKEIPLAAELRHTEWFTDEEVRKELIAILKEYKVSNIIVDSAGRRDLLHMELTTPTAFIRYVGANHTNDYDRLDDWIERIEEWYEKGLKNLYFFVHQNEEKESPLLAAHFIKKFNEKFGTEIKVPKTLDK